MWCKSMLYWKYYVCRIKMLGEYNWKINSKERSFYVCRIKMLGEYNRLLQWVTVQMVYVTLKWQGEYNENGTLIEIK